MIFVATAVIWWCGDFFYLIQEVATWLQFYLMIGDDASKDVVYIIELQVLNVTIQHLTIASLAGKECLLKIWNIL